MPSDLPGIGKGRVTRALPILAGEFTFGKRLRG
jgi:hypothetical protein